MNFARKMPFARDRLVEGYLWILGVYFEPQYSLARRILIKVFAMISIIDDIYDAYGTFEELKLFTEAIERFDTCMPIKIVGLISKFLVKFQKVPRISVASLSDGMPAA